MGTWQTTSNGILGDWKLLSTYTYRFLQVTSWDARWVNNPRFLWLFLIIGNLVFPHARNLVLLECVVISPCRYNVKLFHYYGTGNKFMKYSVKYYQHYKQIQKVGPPSHQFAENTSQVFLRMLRKLAKWHFFKTLESSIWKGLLPNK